MNLRRFVPELHMDALAGILVARNTSVPKVDELPAIGCIIYDFETPVCTAFLRRCEGKYGQIDGLASNPKVSSQKRHIALDQAIQFCLAQAKTHDITHIISITSDNPTLQRAIRNGFTELPDYTISVLNQKE